MAQAPSAHGFVQLYYFNSKKQGEVDFVVENSNDAVLPIDVKSGKDYTVHRALGNILRNEDYNIPEAIALYNDNVRSEGKTTYLPIYMTMFLQRSITPPRPGGIHP